MWKHLCNINEHVIYSRQEFLDIILNLYVVFHYVIDLEHAHNIFSEGFNLQNLSEMCTICTHLKKCLADFIKNVSEQDCEKSGFLEKHIMSFILTGHINLAKFDLIFEGNILKMVESKIYQSLLKKFQIKFNNIFWTLSIWQLEITKK